ncbi:MAG: lipopolysaccharide biosynthesis protein [Solirubrobacterales bacterium]
MNRSKSILRGLARRPRAQAGFAVMSGTLIGAAASFIAAIVAARTLSLDGFAAFGVGMAVNSLTMQFADLGLPTVAMAEAAEANGPHEARHRLVRLAVRRISTAVASGALIALAVILIPSLEPYRDVALVAVGGGVIGCVALFAVGSLQAFRRFKSAGIVQVVLGATRLAAVALAAIGGYGSVAMMVGYGVVAPILASAVGFAILMRHSRNELSVVEADVSIHDEPRSDGRDDDRTRSRADRRRYLGTLAILSAVLLNGDVLLLTSFGSEFDVATYSAAWRFAAGLLLLITALAGAMLPFVLKAPDPWQEMQRLIRIGATIAGALTLLVVPLTFIGVKILGDVGDDATWPLAILLVAFSLDGFYYMAQLGYLRVRRERFLVVLLATELTTMVVITLLLEKYGAYAPAWGQLGARVVICAAVMGPVILRLAGRADWFGTESGERV